MVLRALLTRFRPQQDEDIVWPRRQAIPLEASDRVGFEDAQGEYVVMDPGHLERLVHRNVSYSPTRPPLTHSAQLIEPESARVVAEVRSARFGSGPFSLSSPRRMSLFVTPEVVPMLDAIVLSLIVLQQEIKEQSFEGQYTASGGVMAGATIVC